MTHRLRAVSLLVAGTLLAFASHGRELAMDPEDMVPVELASVGVNPVVGAPVVLLRDLSSGDVVPIFIGVAEARAILMAMREVETARPMTHDLLVDVIGATGGTLQRVFVDQLRDSTYYGMLELHIEGRDEPLLVDSRPSDALALAARTGAQIRVAPDVLVAGQDLEYEGLQDDQVVSALGITVVAATSEFRATLSLPDRPGLLVRRTIGRAADEGLHPGSLILSVNGEVPEAPMDFLDLVRDTPSGEDVDIRYWQDGEDRRLSLPPDLVPRESPVDEPQLEV